MHSYFKELTYVRLKDENKQKCSLEQRDVLLNELSYMETLLTGRLDVLFCNNFLNESVQLLINSIYLMEDGYFDCAFYSIRQSSENINNMLLIASDESKLKMWENKERFPQNRQVLSTLKDINNKYKEIREKLSDFFGEYDELIAKSHKIIHKQGFDTFYKVRSTNLDGIKFNKNDEIEHFVKLIKYSICRMYIMFIILDPIGLILADERINRKFNFNPITDSINLTFIEQNCSYKIIDLLHETSFYKDLVNAFCDNEEMNDDTYSVVREQFFNIETLDNIQKNLINYQEQFILSILQAGFEVSNFHIGGITLLPYWTSIKSNYNRSGWSSDEYDKFAKCEAFNNTYIGVYISRIQMFDDTLYLEHNEMFNESQIELVQKIAQSLNEQYREIVRRRGNK